MDRTYVATDGRTVQLWWGGAPSEACYIQDSLGNTVRHGRGETPCRLAEILDMLNAGDMYYVLHARTLIKELLDGKPLEEIKVH